MVLLSARFRSVGGRDSELLSEVNEARNRARLSIFLPPRGGPSPRMDIPDWRVVGVSPA